MAETLVLRGTMKGHADMVTAIATPRDNPDDMIVSSSRDKSVVVWQLTKEEGTYGVPRRRLTGHSHFVQDVVVSWDGQLALSGSWDGELRLWDTNTGATIRRFVGHTEDVITVALSMDNRQIWSATSNGTIKLWNTLGECKYTFEHTMIKPWDRTLAVSPDRSLGASGGKDEVTLVWDLAKRKKLYSLDAGDATTHALCFSPMKHWLCTATEDSVKIWDLESKSIIQELKPETTETPTTTTTTTTTTANNQNQMPYCTSLSWRGSTLFTGYTDGTIRAWGFQ